MTDSLDPPSGPPQDVRIGPGDDSGSNDDAGPDSQHDEPDIANDDESESETDDGPSDDEGYSLRRKLIVAAVVVALLVAGWLIWGALSGDEEDGGSGGGPPPAVVAAARAQQADWVQEVAAIGSLEAVQGIEVASEVAGKVTAIRFAAGDRARRGALLVTLSAESERREEQAIQSDLDQARTDLARNRRLLERGAIAEREVEAAATRVENLTAQRRGATARTDLSRVRAPFSGELGIRLVSLGQYLTPGTPIVRLTQLTPIYANFSLPAEQLGQVRTGQDVQLSVDSFPDRTFGGRVTAIERAVDENTRSFTVQATIPNRDRALQPGQFADVTLGLGGTQSVVVIPATAVTFNSYGASVFFARELTPERRRAMSGQGQEASEDDGFFAAIGRFFSNLFGGGDEDKGGSDESDGGGGMPKPTAVAERGFVETGERRGLMIAITEGLKAGDRVVTAGQLKVDDGSPLILSPQSALQGAQAVPDTP